MQSTLPQSSMCFMLPDCESVIPDRVFVRVEDLIGTACTSGGAPAGVRASCAQGPMGALPCRCKERLQYAHVIMSGKALSPWSDHAKAYSCHLHGTNAALLMPVDRMSLKGIKRFEGP